MAETNLDRLTVGIGVIWFACIIALGLILAYQATDAEPTASWPTDKKGHSQWLVVETQFVGAESGRVPWARPSGARPRRGRP